MLTQMEALERINGGGLTPPMSIKTFTLEIYPLLRAQGSANAGFIINLPYLDMWAVYLARRAELIEAGEWEEDRPYSVSDMEDIAVLGLYEGDS